MNYKLLAVKKQAKWYHASTIEWICFDHKGFINV